MFVFESSDSSWGGKLPHALQYSLGPGGFSLERFAFVCRVH